MPYDDTSRHVSAQRLAEALDEASRGIVGGDFDRVVLTLAHKVVSERREEYELHGQVRADVLRFGVASTVAEYTDTGDAWDLLDDIYRKLAPVGRGGRSLEGDVEREINPPTEPDPDDARDAWHDRLADGE